VSFTSAFYSFGINYPGAITHHNYSSYMRFLQLPTDSAEGSGMRDMATVDIFRDRERGVPRYCTFRKLFHMTVPKSYLELTGGDKVLAKQLHEVYGPETEGGLEKVDLLIGCLSEPLPKGFGFSDTAFRVFILMASRRLKSDRFIAGEGWSPDYYTKEGMKWVQDNTMSDVLLRHFPELKPGLKGVKNAFAPWRKVGKAGEYRGEETNAPKTEKKKWKGVLKKLRCGL
jgi:Animal haem peroxidase